MKRPSWRAAGARRLSRVLPIALVLVAGVASALDTDIFTGTQVPPNVLIVFDNSGSMGVQAYNTYPNTIYAGSWDPGTVYTRCSNKSGVSGGNVNSNCSCKSVQTNWVVDGSACAGSFVDDVPGPSGDDIDDRESRRKRGNRRNFEDNPPKNCVVSLAPCTSNSQCTNGAGDACAAQNKMAIAKGVMTSVVNDPGNDGLRFGMIIFNPTGINYNTFDYTSTSAVTGYHVNDNVFKFPAQDMTTSARATLTSVIQSQTANGGTPTVHRLIDAWKYFNGQVTASGFASSPVQHTCQRNYVLMVTDGIPEVEGDRLWTDQNNCTFNRVKSFVGTANSGDLNSDGKEVPGNPNYLATTGDMINCGSDYLDDAMFKIRGLFPLGNTENQPLVLYAISFGFDFCEAAPEGSTYSGDGSLLWRAAKKYGGGDCLSAANPDDLDEALREAINLIKNDAQSFVAPVVPVSQTNRTQSGDRLYVALFSPREGQQEWPGNIKKYALDRDNGAICSAGQTTCTPGGAGAATLPDGTILQTAESYWDASTGGPSGSAVTQGGVGAVLKASNIAQRKIYTYTGTATGSLGVSLAATAQAFQKSNAAITPAMLGLQAPDNTTAERDLLIDYVYGYDSYDADNDGVLTEVRNWILGDIIHSVPLIVNYNDAGTDAAIIVGANDGMLHAFDDASGAELWAFVPPDVLDNLNELRPGESSTHPFFVDASAKIYLNGSQKILVFGLGRGGRAYYGLDITSKTSPTLLWRINETTSGYGELGLTMSTPALAKTSLTPSPVAIVGGGYDVYFDDPKVTTANASGAMGRTIYVINSLTGGKVAQASPPGMSFAIPSDPLVFDVNGDKLFDRGYVGDMGGNMWRILDDFTVQRLFDGPPGRRIYYQPDAVINAGSVMVYFGTGDRSSPLSNEYEDRFYAVRDDGTDNIEESGLVDVTGTVAQPGSDGEVSLIEQIADAQGWFIELDGPGEKVLAPPTAFFNVAFTTFIPSTELCDAGGEARVYVVNPLTGSPSFDLAGTSGGNLGNGSGSGSGVGGALTAGDRFVIVGQSIPTSLKVTFGDDETKAFFGVTKGGGIGLQPLTLPQMTNNLIPVSWRQVW
ncbi:MAG: hypothetical protein FJ144_01500 [Deltaproteobacteria bacterium]|nr:hypothetical protein [Deltaproteobacteria bacterium]